MKRFLLVGFAFCLVAVSDFFAATVAAQPGALTQVLTIDGISCRVVSWEGGDARGTVVTNTVGPDSTQQKHLASVAFDPISVEVNLPLPAPLVTLLSDFCNNRSIQKSLALARYSGTLGISPALQADNALLTAVKFSALDAASATAIQVSFVFTAQSVRLSGAPPALAALAANPAPVLASNFAVQLSGVNASNVIRIEPFTIARNGSIDAVGAIRSIPTAASPVIFPDLVISLSTADSTDWTAWRDSFLIAGKDTNEQEKSGSLSLPGTSGAFSLQWSHVGLVRLTSVLAAASTVAHYEAELYLDGMRVGSGAVQGTPTPNLTRTPVTPTSKPTVPSPVSLQPTPTPPPVATTAQTLSPTPSATGKPGPLSPGSVVAQGKPTLAPISAGGDPADQGARDPANFPRPGSSIRKSYTLLKSKDNTEETAIYTCTSPIDQLATFYEQGLTSQGWEEERQVENNNSSYGTHQIIDLLQKGKDSASVTLIDVTSGTVEIHVELSRGN